MKRTQILALILLAGGASAGAAGSACGKLGPLDQPPPLFGAKTRAAYYAHRIETAQASSQDEASQRNATGSAERSVANENDAPNATTGAGGNTTGADAKSGDPNAEDAPLSTRDIPDSEQKQTSPRDAPVPGAPNSMGPTPTVTPPGQ